MPGVLVHEWIERDGGSEKVLDEFVRCFPDADVLCLWDNAGRYPGRTVVESGLARTPLRRSKALALPAMPFVWRDRPGDYDFALVSSHCFAHHVSFRTPPAEFRKYVYVHTPARYLWTPELDERGTSPAARLASPVLRGIDKRTGRILGEVEIPGISRYGMSSWEHNGHQYIIIQLQDGIAAFGLPAAVPQAGAAH